MINGATFDREKAKEEILDNRIVSIELFDFFLGEHIGSGCYRHVFENNFDKTTVVKIDIGNVNANVGEWYNWNQVEHMKISKWFAPIVSMSECGRILIQKKCKPLDKFPDKIPSFFTDVKFSNWGLYKGNPVCFDYSLLVIYLDAKLVDSKRKIH